MFHQKHSFVAAFLDDRFHENRFRLTHLQNKMNKTGPQQSFQNHPRSEKNTDNGHERSRRVNSLLGHSIYMKYRTPPTKYSWAVRATAVRALHFHVFFLCPKTLQ